jgi:ubiquinone/menaquinone biosynthesis C-methylase UbiE
LKTYKKVAIGAGVLTLVYVTAITANYYTKRRRAFERACELVTNKGILNVGCGGAGYRTNTSAREICEHPLVVANIDINDNGVPNFIQVDLEAGSLPFEDGAFDVAFASHVLEHLDNWAGVLNECSRVADNIIVVLPNPLSVSGKYFAPEHKQHFSFQDMRDMELNWPKATVYT